MPYVFPLKCTSSTSAFSMSGRRYGSIESRVSKRSVAALMVNTNGSAVPGGLSSSIVAAIFAPSSTGQGSNAFGKETRDFVGLVFGIREDG